MSTTTRNRLEGRFAGVTLEGYPHPTTTLFVVLTRLVMGGVLLFAGIGKITGDPFDAAGYLTNVHPASPASGVFAWMAETAIVIDAVNVVVPATQVLIGLALIGGVFVRLAAFGGALQMSLFYLGGWEGDWLALFDSTLVYAVVLLLLGAVAAGRIAGVDRHLENATVGGERLLDRWPTLRYLLG